MKFSTFSAAAAVVGLTAGSASAAVLLDFDGLAPGNLAGQQNAVVDMGTITQTGFDFGNASAGIFTVTSSVGVGGSNGLVISNSQPGARLSVFAADADLGASADTAPFLGTATLSFDILVSSDTGSGANLLTVEPFDDFPTANARPAVLQIRDDGTVRGPVGSNFGDGSNPNGFFNEALVNDDGFVTLTFVADYDANSLTVTSSAAAGSFTVPFLNSFRTAGEPIGIVDFANSGNTDVVLDNITYSSTPIPEPTGVGAIAAGLLALTTRRRRA